MTKKTDDFLRRCGMHPDGVDFNEIKNTFIDEMKAGLEGERSSLDMLPSYLSARPAGDGTAVAVDIGGTNLRIALTACQGGQFRILSLDEFPVPGLEREVTKAEFFREIAGHLLPAARQSGNIGVCFSHAVEMLPGGEGRLIAFSKEIKVSGAAGMEILKELSQALREAGAGPAKHSVLLNDTAAVLLGGAMASGGQDCGGYVGFVLGTGMNLSYVERTAEIKKLGGGADDTMIVNTEAGGFGGVPAGLLDRALDAASSNPGAHLLEKMTSGRYLGRLILLTLQKAAADGLLTPPASEAVLRLGDLPLPAASDFMSDPRGGSRLAALCRDESDRDAVYTVADRIVGRAAKLTAAAVAAAVEKTGARPDRPACVTAEGSTFYKLYGFREKFLNCLARGGYGHTRVTGVENATLLGTAAAAMAGR
ncbi:hypothetical protein [Sporobacter termitidis]|uniref:hypothetical protein n=1 Tax=Sporobacter termitidis TaxID=44749 RepID=UPI001FA902B2|nr:hypothetical protein [Sporobacter termitidis]